MSYCVQRVVLAVLKKIENEKNNSTVAHLVNGFGVKM